MAAASLIALFPTTIAICSNSRAGAPDSHGNRHLQVGAVRSSTPSVISSLSTISVADSRKEKICCSSPSANIHGGGVQPQQPPARWIGPAADNRTMPMQCHRSPASPNAMEGASMGAIAPAPASTSDHKKAQSPLKNTTLHKVEQSEDKQMKEWIETIRRIFQSLHMGEISLSPYDTAWVAMVPALDGSKSPQFPKSLCWIIENQLFDGSWSGDKDIFLAYDRVCNTLACLVALKTWNISHESIQRGLEFIKSNMTKIEEEAQDYMPIGFEVVFPTLLDDAKVLGLDLPYDSPIVTKIRKEQQKKFNRIPMDFLHTHPTTLLHSLEGLHRLVDWEKLLKLQSKNGSFLYSPASTACALKYTGDKKCLDYLNSMLNKFNNAVPNVYPVDMFERLWMVDRLERLGISRHFKKEIKECLEYVYKYWTPKGIAWASESEVCDADDTAMAFRLLRLHGYHVSPDVFRQFQKNGQFFCFEGESSQAVTAMHNLYRASQTMFPGESILGEVRDFTRAFLLDKQEKDELHDKWVISKGLKSEIAYTLSHPWYQSLPRIEARNFIDHYGVDDVWIGKSLYRMFNVNNQVFLDLAKADYNMCQSLHQKELEQIQRWNEDCQFAKLTFARKKAVVGLFSAAATLFEPEYSLARLVWGMSCVLTTVIDDYFDLEGSLSELTGFLGAVKCWDPKLVANLSDEAKLLFFGLYNTVNKIQQSAFIAQGRDVGIHLRQAWELCVTAGHTEAKWRLTNHCPTLKEYMSSAKPSFAMGPILVPTLFFLGKSISNDDLKHPDYLHMMDLVDTIGRLNNDIQGFKRENAQGKWSCVSLFLRENPSATERDAIDHFKAIIEDAMKHLVQDHLSETNLPRECKQIYLHMSRVVNLFYSRTDGFSSLTEMSQHIESFLYKPIP